MDAFFAFLFSFPFFLSPPFSPSFLHFTSRKTCREFTRALFRRDWNKKNGGPKAKKAMRATLPLPLPSLLPLSSRRESANIRITTDDQSPLIGIIGRKDSARQCVAYFIFPFLFFLSSFSSFMLCSTYMLGCNSAEEIWLERRRESVFSLFFHPFFPPFFFFLPSLSRTCGRRPPPPGDFLQKEKRSHRGRGAQLLPPSSLLV